MPRIRQVGFAIVRVAAALGYVAMAAACLPFGYDCNDVGCRDGAAISARGVSVADGGMGEHLFFIELDGRSACCLTDCARRTCVRAW